MPLKLSLCTAVWNTSHLLKRSVESYLWQDVDPHDWELIIIDDNSLDDVQAAIAPLEGKLNYRVVRLEHPHGMRGNTVSFNTAFGLAQSPILAETTPECILPRHAVRSLIEPHGAHQRCFVALKVYNLMAPTQLLIDTVDWRSDLLAVRDLPGWNDPMTQRNVSVTHFGTHQICSIRKETWFDITQGRGFPLFGDYGSDDPWYAHQRETARPAVLDITLPSTCMAIHQWHPPFQYWQAKGHAPHLNAWAHSMSNYLGDTSGHVPTGGTCQIWDRGSHQMLTDEQIQYWAAEFDDIQIKLGVPERIVR